MISHLKSKPTNEKMIEVINQAAKIEFQFLLNGLNIDLINMNTDDVIKLIDKNTKSLKYQVNFRFFKFVKNLQNFNL